MNIRIICIGDELLAGDTLNTNLLYIGGRIENAGYRIAGETCVPDDEASIRHALADAQNADAVIIIGGLGPTSDDLTRPVTSAFLGRKLLLHPEIADKITAYLGTRAAVIGRTAIETQSMVPNGAVILSNNNGTAPGLLIENQGTLWFMLPGPPREMKPIFEADVLPRIQKLGQPEWMERVLRIAGIGESVIETNVLDAIGKDPVVHVAYCIKNDHVLVKLFANTEDEDRMELAYQTLCHTFGNNCIPETCRNTAEYLGQLLIAQNKTVSTAESCTGGGIASAMTDIPGSSQWFMGAFVTYDNQWKMDRLGVSAETLQQFGAVSEETVSAMLKGLLAEGHTDYGIAVSGIAGPGGGLPDKPVGTVFIGIASKDFIQIQRCHFNGFRDTVRMRTISTAMNMLINKLLS